MLLNISKTLYLIKWVMMKLKILKFYILTLKKSLKELKKLRLYAIDNKNDPHNKRLNTDNPPGCRLSAGRYV